MPHPYHSSIQRPEGLCSLGSTTQTIKTPSPRAEGLVWKGVLAGRLRANLAGLAVDFFQAGCLAAQSADIEQLGAPHLVAADLLNLVDNLGVEREDALDARAEAHFADGKRALGAVVDGDHQALEGLKALFVAFLDLYLDTNLVAGHKRRQIGALQLVSKALHNGMD